MIFHYFLLERLQIIFPLQVAISAINWKMHTKALLLRQLRNGAMPWQQSASAQASVHPQHKQGEMWPHWSSVLPYRH